MVRPALHGESVIRRSQARRRVSSRCALFERRWRRTSSCRSRSPPRSSASLCQARRVGLPKQGRSSRVAIHWSFSWTSTSQQRHPGGAAGTRGGSRGRDHHSRRQEHSPPEGRRGSRTCCRVLLDRSASLSGVSPSSGQADSTLSSRGGGRSPFRSEEPLKSIQTRSSRRTAKTTPFKAKRSACERAMDDVGCACSVLRCDLLFE